MQNFSGGLFSRRMGAPVSQTNAAEAAYNTAGGLGGAVSPPAGSGRERILAIMYIKFASNNVPGKISVPKKNPLWGAPNCGGPGAAAPFAPLLIRHCLLGKAPTHTISDMYTFGGAIWRLNDNYFIKTTGKLGSAAIYFHSNAM